MTSRAGFTLFEVIIALLLIGLIAAVAAPVLVGGLGASDPRLVAGEMAETFRRVRGAAIADNAEHLIAFDPRSGRYSVAGGAPRSLPPDLEVTVEGAVSEDVEPGIRRVRFFADGTSTGGEVVIADDRKAYRVAVDWLTGRVRIDEAPAGAS